MSGWDAGQLPAVLWWSVGLGGAFLLLVALRKPLAVSGRRLPRARLGSPARGLPAPPGGAVGISLGVNLLNGAVLGVLGAPGLGLLLMLNWLF